MVSFGAILEYNVEKAMEKIESLLQEGKDIHQFIWEMIKYVKDILVYQVSKKLELYNEEELKQIKAISETVSKNRLVDLVYQLSELENSIKLSTMKTVMFQAGIIRLCNEQASLNREMEQRVEKIEKYLKSGKGITVVTNTKLETKNVTTIPVANAPIQTTSSATKPVSNKPRTQTSSGTKKFSNKADEYWPQIVTELKQSGKIVLYTNLMGTKAIELNDMTVGIEFPKGMTSFGKTVLEKPENIREISNLVSMACGKEMQIKYLTGGNQQRELTNEENLQNFAKESDIPFQIVE